MTSNNLNRKMSYKLMEQYSSKQPKNLTVTLLALASNRFQTFWYPLHLSKIPQCGIQDFPVLLTFSFYWTTLQLGAHMATCLDFPIIPSQSFLSSLICLLSFLFCMRACRNRFIHFHAEVILFPVLTLNFYFLLLISMFLSFEAVGYQQVFR